VILKQADSKDAQITQLEQLLTIAPAEKRDMIERELRTVRAGLKGEQEAAYLIDFDLKETSKTGIIHDLRMEIGGRVAQIDHLLIHRTLNIFVLETKHFNAGMKITEDGEFLRWNQYKNRFEGMPSPLAQNERHIAVLKDAFKQIEMPTRLGIRLSPVFHSYVLVSPNSRIDRPKNFDTSRIVKADMVLKTLEKQLDKEGVLETLGSMSRFISKDTLEDIGRKLVAMHQPASFDYAARFGIAKEESVSLRPTNQCRGCGSADLSVEYGRYGYYFKCRTCEGNTPIKIGCGHSGHKERIRKEKLNFYRECKDCGTSSLFFVNPV